jgi:hypothetical protein
LVRVRTNAAGVACCEVRPPDQIGQVLQAAYGPPTDAMVRRVHRRSRRAAASIEAGDLDRAGIEAVMIGLPDVAPEAMARLAEIADLEEGANAAWENEPRIPAGQSGGGQWTTGGGAGSPTAPQSNAAALVDRPERSAERPPSTPTLGSDEHGSANAEAVDAEAADASALVPVSTASTVAGGLGGIGDFSLPKGLAALGRTGLVAFAASLLNRFDAANAHDQINKAIARFGLDAGRPADVMAAAAYVWSRYTLPVIDIDVPFTGPGLDAASEAVMRIVLVNPGSFPAMLQGSGQRSSQSATLIIAAANAGLADYAAESRARPAGVRPELQTTSASARKAIAAFLKNGKMQAHHLVPANVWGENIGIADLASKDGWEPDDPSNLIALPADVPTWNLFGGTLPMHNSSHPKYDQDTRNEIVLTRSAFPPNLTPLQAHAILDSVALENRFRILTRVYYPVLRFAG